MYNENSNVREWAEAYQLDWPVGLTSEKATTIREATRDMLAAGSWDTVEYEGAFVPRWSWERERVEVQRQLNNAACLA